MNELSPLSSFPLGQNFMLEQNFVSSRTIDVLKSHGINLSPTQISQLETQRKEGLAKSERLEFHAWGLRVLLEDLASSEIIHPIEFAQAAQSAIALFYGTRDIVDPAIDDQEIAELIVSETIRKEVCIEHLDSFELAVSSRFRQPTLSEELAQNETGATYCWNSEDWEYDEYAPGWDGESWEDDHE